MELSLFFSYVFTLSIVMDPLGNVPLFLTAIRRVPDSRKTRVIMRELVIALFIMLFFFFFGKYFLKALDLDVSAMAIGGGIILFIIGLQMIFPSKSLASGSGDAAEPFIVPLAVPLVAGPSTLTTVMLLSAHNEGTLAGWVGVLFVSWLINAVILAGFSVRLAKLLGTRGLMAVEKLMGMMLVAISVQMVINAVRQIQQT